MSAIGRLAASLVSGTNENTFALANFNLDFTLIKVEAPAEYQGLRSALSKRRVEDAEQGQSHRTARKLGALFEQILPPIKTLTEAYGKRVSEIVASEKLSKKVSDLPYFISKGVCYILSINGFALRTWDDLDLLDSIEAYALCALD